MTKGQQVKVAILDSGIETTDLEFSGRIIECHSELAYTKLCEDDNGHGTRMAGIIAATGNREFSEGVAPEALLLVDKILDDQAAAPSPDTIAAGIQWAIASDADVINISVGFDAGVGTGSNCDLNWPNLTEAVHLALVSDIPIVASTGNDSTRISSPACISGVIAVGGVDETDVITTSSGRGNLMTERGIVAPSFGYTNNIGTDYELDTGTSIAAAHVTGVVALMLSSNGNLSPAEISNILFSTTCHINTDPSCPTGSTPNSIYGHGRVDAYSAFRKVLNNPTVEIRVISASCLLPAFECNDLTNKTLAMGQAIRISTRISDMIGIPRGSITYQEYSSADCVGTLAHNDEIQIVSQDGSVPKSSPRTVTVDPQGMPSVDRCFQVFYHGDGLNNNPGLSKSAKVSFGISAKIRIISEGVDVTDGMVPINSNFHVSAEIANQDGRANSAIYNRFNNSECKGIGEFNTPDHTEAVQINTDLSVPDSSDYVLSEPGTVSYSVTYGNVISECHFVIVKAFPSVSTSIVAANCLNTMPIDCPDLTGKLLPIGTVVKNAAVLVDHFGIPTGTVVYQHFNSLDCSGASSDLEVILNDGNIPLSGLHAPTILPDSPHDMASISFRAEYSGDNDNSGAISDCAPVSFSFVTDSNLFLEKPALTSLMSEDNILRAGQQAVLSTTVRNDLDRVQEFVVIIEIRNTDDVTVYLSWQRARIEPKENIELFALWTPDIISDYSVRTFAISDFNSPHVLSTISSTEVNVL